VGIAVGLPIVLAVLEVVSTIGLLKGFGADGVAELASFFNACSAYFVFGRLSPILSPKTTNPEIRKNGSRGERIAV
jgi:hypothetical protein